MFFHNKRCIKKIKKKSDLTINAISGIDGLEPTLDIIKYYKKFSNCK